MELLLLLAAVALIMIRSPQAPFKRRPTHVIAGSALALGIAGLSSIKAFKVDDLVVLLVLISSLISFFLFSGICLLSKFVINQLKFRSLNFG